MRIDRAKVVQLCLAIILLLLISIQVWQRTSHGNQLHVGSFWASASVGDVAVSPDGEFLAAATGRGLYVWELPNRQQHWHLPDERGGAIAWSPDGRFLAATTFDAYLHIWSVTDQTLIATVAGNRVGVDDLAWSGDGQWIVAAARDEKVRIWQVHDGTVVATLPPLAPSPTIGRVAFSPDSRLLATNGFQARLWSFPTGIPSQPIDVSTTAVAFAPDGAMLAISEGNTVQFCAVSTGVCGAALPRQRDVVGALAYSPNAELLALGLGSRHESEGPSATTVQLWSIAEVNQLESYAGHRDIVTSVAFTPDGQTLVSGSEDGTIRFWRVP